MTAVLDVADCPQCGWRAFYEFQTGTLTATVFCPRCGYRAETHPIKNRKTKSGDLVYRTNQRRGWGAYMLTRGHGVSEIGALDRPLTRQAMARFQAELRRPGVDAARSFLTRWNPKRRRVEMVIGKFPRDLP